MMKPTSSGRRIRLSPAKFAREVMEELHMTEDGLAKKMKRPVRHVKSFLFGSLPVTPSVAKDLGRVFKSTPQFWINLQTAHDESKWQSHGTWRQS